MSKRNRLRDRRVFALLVMALLVGCLPVVQPSGAWPATRGGLKNLQLFLHYGSAQTVGGVSTNYIANTLKTFQSVKNHDSKTAGQPKITLDFYLYPPFAGQVRLTGSWQVIVFANSTALHPAGWSLEFWEKSSSGSILWDSGSLSPTVLGGPSGNNGYIDAPVYGYTLTTSNLTRAFASGNTLEVEVSVNTGSTVPVSLWYDSPQEPSRMILPSNDYMLVSGVSTKDANGTLRTVYFTFWSAGQRSVTIGNLVTDPFGGYDINGELVSIRAPTGSYVVANQSMQKTSGTIDSFSSSFSYAFQYASDAPRGNYSVTVLALDNNAVGEFVSTGRYFPFAQVASTTFSIGLQYPVNVGVTDKHGVALQGARVTFLSGPVAYATGLTGIGGSYRVSIFAGDFTVRVSWEGVPVLSQNVTVRGVTNLNLTASVFYPTLTFVTDLKSPLAGALVFLHFPNGSATLLPYITDPHGSFSLRQQPQGSYSLLVLYQGVKVAQTVVDVSSDGPYITTTNVFRLTVIVKDAGGSPLDGAGVLVSGPGAANGSNGYQITASNGDANFSLPEGAYTVTVLFDGVKVAESLAGIPSDGPFVMKANVFRLTVIVKDAGGSPLDGAEVLVSGPGATGSASGYLVTGSKGEANFSRLPGGTYKATAEYNGVYFLSPISNTTSASFTVNTEREVFVMEMKNIPPAIWLTLGFQLVLAVVLIAAALFLFFRRR